MKKPAWKVEFGSYGVGHGEKRTDSERPWALCYMGVMIHDHKSSYRRPKLNWNQIDD